MKPQEQFLLFPTTFSPPSRVRYRSLLTTCSRPSSAQHTEAARCRWPSSTCSTSWTNKQTNTPSQTTMYDTPGRVTGKTLSCCISVGGKKGCHWKTRRLSLMKLFHSRSLLFVLGTFGKHFWWETKMKRRNKTKRKEKETNIIKLKRKESRN